MVGGGSGVIVQGSELAIHVTTIIAGTQKVFLKPFEAAGRDMPHLGAYLAHRAGTAATTRRATTLLSLLARGRRRRWGLLATARGRVALADPLLGRSRRWWLVGRGASTGSARGVVGRVDVGAEFGASRLYALLSIEKLRVDVADG